MKQTYQSMEYMYVYECIYVCMYICMHVFMYVRTYVCLKYEYMYAVVLPVDPVTQQRTWGFTEQISPLIMSAGR